jgi:hypothetical protein
MPVRSGDVDVCARRGRLPMLRNLTSASPSWCVHATAATYAAVLLVAPEVVQPARRLYRLTLSERVANPYAADGGEGAGRVIGRAGQNLAFRIEQCPSSSR